MNSQKLSISDSVGDILYQLSGIEINDHNCASSFIELGFDSLFLIQFSTKLKKALGVEVTFRQMLSEISSVELLINHINATAAPALPTTALPAAPEDNVCTDNVFNIAAATTATEKQAIDTQPADKTDGQPRPAPVRAPVQSTHQHGSSSRMSETPSPLLESVVRKQLEIMAHQIAALSGRSDTVATTHSAMEAGRTENASSEIAQTEKQFDHGKLQPMPDDQSVKSEQPRMVEKSKPATLRENKPQPFGAIARIQTGTSDTLTDVQRDWLVRFIYRYNVRTEKSKAFTERYRNVHADPRVVTGFKPELKELVYPIVAKRTNGCRIWDLDDNEYIDALNGFGSNYFGYADPDITQAVVDQLWQGAEIGPQNPLTGETAKLICEFTGMDRVGFCNTGSEAVMGAMRIARTMTGKDLIVIFNGSYHGIFDEVLVRGTPHLRSIPAAPGITEESVQNVLVLDYGTDESISIIQDRIDEIAAVMVEPVQSRRPQFQPREFLHKLRSITETNDVPFIFDEVITGFRTAPGGAQEFFDIKADIATYGKVIGGGMQIGVVAGRKKYMDALDGGSWEFGNRSEPEQSVTYFAGTFVRHPASIAACLAALTLLKNGGPELQQGTNQKTVELAATLNKYFQDTGVPIAVTWFGSLWRMEFEQSEDFGDLLFYLIREKGIHIYNRFPCFLTLKHTDKDVNSIVDAIKDSVVELQSVGFIGSKKKTHDAVTHDFLAKRRVNRDYPLTQIQTAIWLTAQFSDEGNYAYNEPLLLKLQGKCKLDALRNAINTVYLRHDALHARFSADGVFQQFSKPRKLKLPFLDFTENKAETGRDSLNAIIDRVSKTPFDLAQGPLVKIEIVQFSDNETILVCTAHHIVCDGWSWNVLLGEIGTAYTAIVTNTTPKLSDAHSFRDFVIQDFEYDLDVKAGKSNDHWISQLTDTPLYLDLPTDRARPLVRTFDGDTITHHIPIETYQQLKALSATTNTSLFALLSAAFLILMSRISQQQRLIISTPVAGQMLSGQFDLVGCCIRLLPIAADVDENLTFDDYLDRMKTIILDGFENLNTDLSELLKNRMKTYNSNRIPFSEVCFNLDRDEAGVKFDQLTSKVEQTRKIAVVEDIFFNVNESSNGLKIDCDFNTTLFDRSTVQRWILGFETLLGAIAQTPELPIRQLNSIPKQENDFLLQHRAADQYPVSDFIRIDDLFDDKALKSPDATAVIFDGHSLSYEDLYQRSNKLANHLQHIGVSSGDNIGIYLDRSPLALIAMLATMKAGAVCVPLDPSYPIDRIRYMIEDSNVKLILSNESCMDEQSGEQTAFSQQLVYLDKHWSDIQEYSNEFSSDDANREKVAFVLYTSASTGSPVGVRTLHTAHIQRFEWMWRQYPFAQAEICCQKTSLCFIDSVWELFGPLLKGVPSVFIPTNTLMDSYRFLTMLDTNQISRIVLVPSLMRLLVSSAREMEQRLPALKLCFSSGETLPPDLALEFNAQFPHCKLVNLYGTTEVSGDATFHEFEPLRDQQRVAIGRPIDNTRTYLLDRYENPVPIGVTGEICVSGGILCDGYNNQPDLNTDRFVNMSADAGVQDEPQLQVTRLFKTGDLGKLNSDGCIEYIGRKDSQIQVNGIRIDPAEVEAALASHDSVAECLIESSVHTSPSTPNNNRSDSNDNHSLMAYLRTYNNSPANVAEIKDHMRGLVPLYMVPQQIVQLNHFPLTPNGKLDRSELLNQPVPALVNVEKTRTPRNHAEEVLLQTWRNGIGINDINMEDNYFDIGSSFTLIKIISDLHQNHGISVSIQDFLYHPTLEQLAQFIAPQFNTTDRHTEKTANTHSIIQLREGGDMPPLLLIPPAGVTETYFMAMLSKLDKSIPVFSINQDEILQHDSLIAYAGHLAGEWTRQQPSTTCMVAGMCLGAHLAFELTNQLNRHGHIVSLLTIIDHDAPEIPGNRSKGFFSQSGPMAPAVRALQHLRAGRLSRLFSRAAIAVERNFDDQLDHYMKLLDWQIKISSDYKGTPCNADVFLIQSEEFADSRNLARQWRPLTTGNLTVETLEDVMHEELSEGNPEPHYHVADAMNLHIEKLITEHML